MNTTHIAGNWRVGRIGREPHAWFRHALVDEQGDVYPPIPLYGCDLPDGELVPTSALAHAWSVLAARRYADFDLGSDLAHEFHKHLGPWFDKFVEMAECE